MERNAYAKINLSLDVIGKREDGYHELDMVFLEISLCDRVILEAAEEPGIRLSCSDPSLANGKNLAYRAAQMMFETYGAGRGVSIHIEKSDIDVCIDRLFRPKDDSMHVPFPVGNNPEILIIKAVFVEQGFPDISRRMV